MSLTNNRANVNNFNFHFPFPLFLTLSHRNSSSICIYLCHVFPFSLICNACNIQNGPKRQARYAMTDCLSPPAYRPNNEIGTSKGASNKNFYGNTSLFLPRVANTLTQIDKYIESPDFPMPNMRRSNETCSKAQFFLHHFST